MKKKIIVIVSVIVFCTGLVSSLGAISENYFKSNRSTKKEKKAYNISKKTNDKKSIENFANNRDIKKEDLENKAKALSEEKGTDYAEEYSQLEKKMIEEKSLQLASKDAKIVITGQEVKAACDKLKQNISENEEVSAELEAYIAGQGITEDEYWKITKNTLKYDLAVNEYLYQEYAKMAEKEKADVNDLNKREQWKQQIIDNAVKKYDVQVK